MNGAQHYAEAECLLAEVAKLRAQVDAQSDAGLVYMTPEQFTAINTIVVNGLAEAQVHATLALAAASAQNIRRNGAVGVDDAGAAWAEALTGAVA